MTGSSTLGTVVVSSRHVHLVDGVSIWKALVGLMCGATMSFCRNVTIGAQYDSGLLFHMSLDRSMCRRGVRGVLFRSPHNRVVHVWCGATKELFKHKVWDVPLAAGRRGNVTGVENLP